MYIFVHVHLYLCNQCLSPLRFVYLTPAWHDKVCQFIKFDGFAICPWPDFLIFFTNNNDCHNTLFKMVINTQNQLLTRYRSSRFRHRSIKQKTIINYLLHSRRAKYTTYVVLVFFGVYMLPDMLFILMWSVELSTITV